MYLKIVPFLLFSLGAFAQNLADFTSLVPGPQNSNFVIPSTHRFQKIIEAGDPLTKGGQLLNKNDFTGYVPIEGSSENGYLSINAEAIPGGVSILDINYNSETRVWETTASEAVDFSDVYATVANCSGTITPWNTIITCEEWTSAVLQNDSRFPFEGSRDFNNDGYDDFGWAIEIDPVTKTVIDQPGGIDGPDKLWALGNFKHENLVIHSNERTAYQGVDASTGYLYKFVADVAQNLSSGKLYVYKGSKNGSGVWIQINNGTQEEQNSTIAQSAAVDATVFSGIEDVEIGPDGLMYFAVKNENQIYRFQDSDPITGTSVPMMETYVGNATYAITHENGSVDEPWGGGNDNLAFDGQGNLWVNQDANNLQNYIWVVENGHTQSNPKVKIFARTPIGSESTGITFSPDYRFMFMSIQHPSSRNNISTQIDAAGNAIAFDKAITVVISLVTPPNQTWYLDNDQDGFAHSDTIQSPDSPGNGYSTNILPTTDCNDQNAEVNPNTIWYKDSDGDGFADPIIVQSCQSPGIGFSMDIFRITDCNDSDASVNEISSWYLDADGDGFAISSLESCNSPGIEYVSTVLPITDCNDSDASVNEISSWYLDADGDGYAISSLESCSRPGIEYVSTVLPITDCDDSDASVNEITTWYLDADGDGYAISSLENCNSPGIEYVSTVLPITDCDDSDATVNEITIWYLDADGDGFALSDTVVSCESPGEGYTKNELPTTDCDDFDASINTEKLWYLDANQDGFADDIPISSCNKPGEGFTSSQLLFQNDLIKDGSIFYPNPTTDEVFILLDSTYPELLINVLTLNGSITISQVVYDTNNITIDLTGKQAGVYFIQIISEGESVEFFKVAVL